jgi:hypothetical protein
VHPTRKVAVQTTIGSVRSVRGVVAVKGTVRISNRGNRAERGRFHWRIVGPRGRTVARGSLSLAVGVGGTLRLPVGLRVGLAVRRPAGSYRLVTFFRSDHRTWRASTKRFWQPY